MKHWKQGFIGLLVVFALAFAFIACNDGNGNKDLVCDCTVKEHPNGSPCTCPAAGTAACDCTEAAPICDCTTPLKYYDDECDCGLANCNCSPIPYQMFYETIPIYLKRGVVNQDTTIGILNGRFSDCLPEEKFIIAGSIRKIIIVPGTNECNINNQENGKYIVEIGENATRTRMGIAIIHPILNAPLNNGI